MKKQNELIGFEDFERDEPLTRDELLAAIKRDLAETAKNLEKKGEAEEFFNEKIDNYESNLIAGLAERMAKYAKMLTIKDYCTQNNGNCPTCSLVNYGRDCRNNPIKK
jgi:DNA repair exonuclease SbcCD ATPase subunit